MEHSRRPLAVGAESLEERGAVTLGHAGGDGQVQLKCTFAGVEDATEVVAHLAGDVFDGYFTHQVHVDFGPDLGQARCQNLRSLIGRVIRKII